MKTELDNLIDNIQRGKPCAETNPPEPLNPFRDEFEKPNYGFFVERPLAKIMSGKIVKLVIGGKEYGISGGTVEFPFPNPPRLDLWSRMLENGPQETEIEIKKGDKPPSAALVTDGDMEETRAAEWEPAPGAILRKQIDKTKKPG